MKNLFLFISFSIIWFSVSCQNSKKKHKEKTTNIELPVYASSHSLIGPLAESKIHKLLNGMDKSDHFGASGIYYLNHYFYVVFDNTYKIGKIADSLPQKSEMNMLIGKQSGKSNYEGITFNNSKEKPIWYVVEESVERDTAYFPRVNEFDFNFNLQKTVWSNYLFSKKHKNKAFEGIAYVKRNNIEYLLGLVEGTGSIAVMKQINNTWTKIAEFQIPSTFNDYSDITIYGNTIAVCSQEDAKLWVGKLNESAWLITDKGTVYDFPKGDEDGKVGAGNLVIYGNVEGVSFINDSTIVTCTDRITDKQPRYQKHKDQSIQIFRLR